MKRVLLAAAAASALMSQSAWAVSGQPLAAAAILYPHHYPNGRMFSTADDPGTWYCVSSQDPAGNLIFSMMAQDLRFMSYGIAPLPVTFTVGNPGAPFNAQDCPPGSYVYDVGIGNPNPDPTDYPYQAIKVAMNKVAEPYCLQYRLAYAPDATFGASVNDPDVQDYLNHLVTSIYYGGAISSVPGGANPQDCPATGTYVSSITIQ